MPECRPQRGAFETWILCSGVEIGAFTGGAATGCGGPSRPNREKPNKYRYIPPAVVGMLEIAMQACQVSSESIRMWPSPSHTRARTALQNCRSPEFRGRRETLSTRAQEHAGSCSRSAITWVYIALCSRAVARLAGEPDELCGRAQQQEPTKLIESALGTHWKEKSAMLVNTRHPTRALENSLAAGTLASVHVTRGFFRVDCVRSAELAYARLQRRDSDERSMLDHQSNG